MVAVRRHAWDERDDRTGRYVTSPPCDACGKPVGTDYITDGLVCGNGDGPGFYLCDRKRCRAKRELLSVENRRSLYTEQRKRNEGGSNEA